MLNYVLPAEIHNTIVQAAFRARGFDADESAATARLCESASRHGIRTHNAIKALHLDEMFGLKAGGCVPGARVEKLPSRYEAVEKWNAHRKLGPPVAYAAMEACMRLADRFGVGVVTVDNAFHYFWGGGYVNHAADRGYIAYTGCTAALAEVVPFGGSFPTLGTNPHSWAFPTRDVLGFNVIVDFASSTVAMGRVQQLTHEGKPLPPGSAVDENGAETTDPIRVKALLPFGGHKGYGLAVIDELLAAFTGGSLPTLRSRWNDGRGGEKHTPSFFFQCIAAEALDCGDFALGRSQRENVAAVLRDIVAHGNDRCLLPGEPEARFAARCAQAAGLLFTRAEIDALADIAALANVPFDPTSLKTIEVE